MTDSSLWAAFTTAASNGSVSAMRQLHAYRRHGAHRVDGAGRGSVPEGVGCGLYGMLGFVILTVFIRRAHSRAARPKYLEQKKSARRRCAWP